MGIPKSSGPTGSERVVEWLIVDFAVLRRNPIRVSW
jgi:hypothetical protein